MVEPIDPDVVAAWRTAGAELGWMGADWDGQLHWFPETTHLSDAIPAFQMGRGQAKGFGELPVPRVPFGLCVWDEEMSDADLNGLSRFQSLHSLQICNYQITNAGFTELVGLTNLRNLSLFLRQVTDPALGVVANMTELEHLSLYSRHLSDDGLKVLGDLKHLRYFRFSRDKDQGEAGLPNLAKLSRVETLVLDHCYLNEECLKDIGKMNGVRNLSLRSSRYSNDWLTHLTGLTELRELDLGSGAGPDADDDLPVTDPTRHVAKLKNLRVLSLRGAGIDDDGVKRLSQLTRLIVLNLNDSDISDDGVTHLAKLRQLEELFLDGSELTDDSTKVLGGMKSLKTLGLRGCRITDVGVGDLARLTELTSLDLGGTGFNDCGVDALCKLKKLERLDLSGTTLCDDGLGKLTALRQIKDLDLEAALITDAGLHHLLAFPRLESAVVGRQVTGEGVEKIRKALAGRCIIIGR